VRGGAEREIVIDLDASRLAGFGLTVGQVAQALAAENLDIPAGRLDGAMTETSLRVEGEVDDWRTLADLVVANVGGQVVRVGDLGTVSDGVAEQRTLVRVAGQEAIALDVVKQSGGNTMAVAEGVKEQLED